MEAPTVCDCNLCKLSRRIKAERINMTDETLSIVRELWNRLEEASIELCQSEVATKERQLDKNMKLIKSGLSGNTTSGNVKRAFDLYNKLKDTRRNEE